MYSFDSLPPIAIIIIQIFIFFTIILWALLPFAVFGVKSRLDKLNNTAQDILKELQSKQGSNAETQRKRIEAERIEPEI